MCRNIKGVVIMRLGCMLKSAVHMHSYIISDRGFPLCLEQNFGNSCRIGCATMVLFHVDLCLGIISYVTLYFENFVTEQTSKWRKIPWMLHGNFYSQAKGWFTWSPKSHSCQQVPTWRQRLESQKTMKVWFISIKAISCLDYAKVLGLVLQVGSTFCSTHLSRRVPRLTSKSVAM